MAIGDDFSIDYVNKVVKHVSGTTVYTVNELYSWLMDTFDELLQMDDEVPMSAQTPTEYTMINGWFLDIGELSQAHKYLKGGAIKTDGYENEIQVLTLCVTTHVVYCTKELKCYHYFLLLSKAWQGKRCRAATD